jgi:hypothetical protein
MQINACNNIGPHNSSDALPTALQLVGELTEEQYNELLDFAETRLGRVTTTPEMERLLAGITAHDLVHGAYERLKLGDGHPKKGQQLPTKSRRNTATFVNYVKSVINSDLHILSTSLEASIPHLSLDGPALQGEFASGADSPDLS